MGLSAADYTEQLNALLPPGKAYECENDSVLHGLLQGMADELARVDAAGSLLVEESDPRTTYNLLTDWELDYGLPDLCSGEMPDVPGRLKLLLEKVRRLGEQTPQYFIDLAAVLGYEITVIELRPHTVVSPVDFPLYGNEIRNVWQVRSVLDGISYADVNSGVLTPLASWGNSILECVIKRAKPAHTHVQFSYSDPVDLEPYVRLTEDGEIRITEHYEARITEY